MDFDNHYDALRFDLGMAYKGYLAEKEEQNEAMTILLNGMRAIVMSNGAESPKIPQPKPLLKREKPNQDELPRLEDVLKALGG